MSILDRHGRRLGASHQDEEISGAVRPLVSNSQKVNLFPRMSEICRKDLLSRNLNRMRKSFPDDYNFFPATWVLPAEYVVISHVCMHECVRVRVYPVWRAIRSYPAMATS